MTRWRVLLPTWVLDMAGGLAPLRESFERCADEGTLKPGCVGFEIVGDLGVPDSPDHIYTCLRFRA